MLCVAKPVWPVSALSVIPFSERDAFPRVTEVGVVLTMDAPAQAQQAPHGEQAMLQVADAPRLPIGVYVCCSQQCCSVGTAALCVNAAVRTLCIVALFICCCVDRSVHDEHRLSLTVCAVFMSAPM